jgi:hypothetical protein
MSASIMDALNAHLNTFATSEGITVAWEGVDFTPPAGAYLRAFLLPAMTIGAALGTDAPNKHRGIYQVDCIYPGGSGWGACAAMAEKVRVQFKRGTRLMSNDLIIESVSFGPGMMDGSRYKIPVSISYWAFLAN